MSRVSIQEHIVYTCYLMSILAKHMYSISIMLCCLTLSTQGKLSTDTLL